MSFLAVFHNGASYVLAMFWLGVVNRKFTIFLPIYGYFGVPAGVQSDTHGPRRRTGLEDYENSSKIIRGPNYLELDLTSILLSKVEKKSR